MGHWCFLPGAMTADTDSPALIRYEYESETVIAGVMALATLGVRCRCVPLTGV